MNIINFKGLAKNPLRKKPRSRANSLQGISLLITEAMGMKLYPQFNLNKELQPFVEKALKTYLEPKRALQTLKTDIFDYLGFLKTLPEKTQGLLQKIEKGDLTVKIDATELLGIKTEFDRQNDLRVLGAATISLFIISAVFSYLKGAKTIAGIKFSSISLFISAFLLLWLLARVIKKPKE